MGYRHWGLLHARGIMRLMRGCGQRIREKRVNTSQRMLDEILRLAYPSAVGPL